MTCRESEEVFCPGTDIKCSDTLNSCCPNNTTCPSASVQQVSECGPKSVDCQAPLSAQFSCAIGEFVFCPAQDSDIAELSSAPAKECSAHSKCGGLEGNCCPTADGVYLDCCEGTYTYRNEKCHGNQCCPDGSTCPSAPAPEADGCGPKKATCELLGWTVKLSVTSIIFANVDDDTVDLTETLVEEYLGAKVGTDNVEVIVSSAEDAPSSGQRRLTEEGMVVTAKVSAPGGWSQKKFDHTMESNILSEETSGEMEEMLSEIDGLQEASSGDMEFQKVEAEKDEPPATTEAPTDSPPNQAPSTAPPGVDGGTTGESLGTETSSASTCHVFPAIVALVLMKCR